MRSYAPAICAKRIRQECDSSSEPCSGGPIPASKFSAIEPTDLSMSPPRTLSWRWQTARLHLIACQRNFAADRDPSIHRTTIHLPGQQPRRPAAVSAIAQGSTHIRTSTSIIGFAANGALIKLIELNCRYPSSAESALSPAAHLPRALAMPPLRYPRSYQA